MRSLYLVRHGIALPHGTPDIADDDRPLTEQGRKRMRDVARGLARLEIHVERIISSPLPRARQTAEIVADVLDFPESLEFADALRVDRSASDIAQWLSNRSEESLMLVGHNPSLSELVGFLTLGEPRSVVDLRRGGVAALTQAGPAAGYTLDWLARPRLLRRLAE
jgi:phosphohistidine phosphatase